MLGSIRKEKKTEYFQILLFFAPNFRLFSVCFLCCCADAVRWPKVKATRRKQNFFLRPQNNNDVTF